MNEETRHEITEAVGRIAYAIGREHYKEQKVKETADHRDYEVCLEFGLASLAVNLLRGDRRRAKDLHEMVMEACRKEG